MKEMWLGSKVTQNGQSVENNPVEIGEFEKLNTKILKTGMLTQFVGPSTKIKIQVFL